MQAYSDPRRASDPHALPDLEVFELTAKQIVAEGLTNDDGEPREPGWYWWACFPGCMPDSDMVGPFETSEAALLDAREGEDFADALEAMSDETRAKLTARLEGLHAQGFDRSEIDEDEEAVRVRCSQCEALTINGVACHERGCPNTVRESKTFDDFDLTGDEDDDNA